MNITLEMNSDVLNDLQMHMEELVKYYEADVAALGRIEPHVKGEALEYLKELMQHRLEQLDSADSIWNTLVEK